MFWVGLLLIFCGVFLLVYGGKLFRFALAVGFFVLGFSLAMWLLSSQSVAVRLLISLVVGGALALVGYLVVKMVLHFAGALLGAMLVLLILSLLPFPMPDFLTLIVILAGAGVVGFFGNRLGDWIIILGTTLAGAYSILIGLVRIFPVTFGVSADYTSAIIPLSLSAVLLLLIYFATGVLAQWEIRRVRGRYVNF